MIEQELRWIPFFMLLRREISRFLKVVAQTVVTPFVSSFLYLLIFGVSLGSQVKTDHDYPYLAFLIPGLMMMTLLNNSFQNSSSSIISAKFSGDLEDLRIAPLSYQQIVWALSVGGLIRGWVVGIVTLVVGQIFYRTLYTQWLPIEHPLYLLLFCLLGGLTFAKLGIGVGFWSKSFEQVSAFGAFLLLPLTYLGGVFISIRTLHPFWQTLSQFNPLFYFINGVRYGMLGASDVPVETSIVVCFASLIVFHIFAVFCVRKGSFARW